MTASDFIRGMFFMFSIIKNFRHEKSRFVRKKLASGRPALAKRSSFRESSFVLARGNYLKLQRIVKRK